MWNLCTSALPNTPAWERQELNKTKKQEEDKK